MTKLHIIFGPQGAGKTTYARRIAKETQGMRFSIDEWMGELFGPDLPKAMDISWIMQRVGRCERRIGDIASEIIECGGSAVLDLGLMKIGDRARWASFAQAKGLPAQWHYIDAPLDLRRERVFHRNATKGETFAFEVTPAMFDFMEQQFESPNDLELANNMVQIPSE